MGEGLPKKQRDMCCYVYGRSEQRLSGLDPYFVMDLYILHTTTVVCLRGRCGLMAFKG